MPVLTTLEIRARFDLEEGREHGTIADGNVKGGNGSIYCGRENLAEGKQPNAVGK